jgi:hypothetical protein
LAVGDSVRVIATLDGSTLTATSVQSGTAAGIGRPGRGVLPEDGTLPDNADAAGEGAPQTS